MKKLIAALLCAACLLALCACTRPGSPIVHNDDGVKADKRLELVVQAVKSRDKAGLKDMFSERAVNEAKDLNGRLDYLLEFIQGDIISWKAIVSGATDGVYNYGSRMTKSRSWYSVKTDKEEYLFFLLEYPEDTEHPDNVGLYMLQVIKMADKKAQFDGGQKILCAGIYKPEEATDGEKNNSQTDWYSF